MTNIPILVAILAAAAIFFTGLYIAAAVYGRGGETGKKLKNLSTRFGSGSGFSEEPEAGSGNLAGDFCHILYRSIFGTKDPVDTVSRFGIDPERFSSDCAVVGMTADLKKLAIHYTAALVLLVLGVIMLLTAGILPGFLCAGTALIFMTLDKSAVSSKAKQMKAEIASELPNFLDLLRTELAVGVPVENAICDICEKKDSLLSREFIKAMNEMQMGASGWEDALESMADRYDVDTLTDFVFEVTTAYRNGTSITQAVTRKAEDIKQVHLLNIKERAGKTTNTILIPLTIFQIIPLIAFFLIPAFVGTLSGLS